jgi:uncharacterized RDD family membrane protein YckC
MEPVGNVEARRILVEGVTSPPPCGIFIRCVAGIIDLLVVWVVLFWLTLLLRQEDASGNPTLPWWGIALFLLWWLVYYFACEYFWRGQTLGKRATRIRVVMGSGTPLTREAALKRTIARPVDMLPWLAPYALGVLWMLATGPQRRQRLGDKWGDTKVVYVDPRRVPQD